MWADLLTGAGMLVMFALGVWLGHGHAVAADRAAHLDEMHAVDESWRDW